MRILIAGTIQGDNGYEEEYLVKGIEKYLKDNNQIVDSFMLPYSRDMLSLPEQIVAYQMIDLSNIDLLITVGYPACMLNHNNKIVYLFETAPMLNEYWDSEYGVLANPQYSKLLGAINTCEMMSFKAAKKIVCNSQLLSTDIANKYMVEAITLYYPDVFDSANSKIDITEPYYVSETSLLPNHRIELILDLMKEVSNHKLYLFIPKTNSVYLETLYKQIDERKLNNIVCVNKGIIPENILQNAKAYISTDYQIRKVPGGVIRSASHGINIIACEDSGAIEEFLRVHKCGATEEPDVKLLSKRLANMSVKRRNSSEDKMSSIETFMRRLTTI